MKQTKTDSNIIKVGRIEYVNVAPVYYGLEQEDAPANIQLVRKPPAVLNHMMEQGRIDISPVSSAAFARNHHQWSLLPNLSISSFGTVMSVILASHYPLEELDNRKILLSDESASAADMLRLVLSWKHIFPRFETGSVTCDAQATYADYDAVLVIGNNALSGGWNHRFQYGFDLGELWKEVTGLPFVFAVWAVRKAFARQHPIIVTEIARHFEHSKQLGRRNIDKIEEMACTALDLDPGDCHTYFQILKYGLGHFELLGLKKFYQGLYEERIIPDPVKLAFFPTLINGEKTENDIPAESSEKIIEEAVLFSRQKSALLNLGLRHLPVPLKKVFPQLLHLLRQDRR
jgi:chorismate dehydratase